MGKAKITVTGVASKPPKIKEDKTVDLIIKVDMSPAVPKGLKSLGQSICLVHVGSKTWKKIAETVKDDSFYIIQGEVKSNVNNKSVPFLEIVAFDIALKLEASQPKKEKEQPKEQQKPKEIVELPKKEAKVEKIETEQPEKQKVQKQETENKEKNVNTLKKTKKNDNNKYKGRANYTFKEWYTPEEIKYVSYKELVLEEQIHLETPAVGLKGGLKLVSEGSVIKNPLAVRTVQNGKYALITGFKNYVIAKVLGLEKIPVVVKDMTYNEFVKEYAVDTTVHHASTK